MRMMLQQGVYFVSWKMWWDKLCSFSGSFGYNVNAVKCWLVVKEGLLQRANHVFTGTGVQVTSTGRPYLGVVLHLPTCSPNSVSVNGLREFLISDTASCISCCFTHGYLPKWNYYLRTTPNISNLLSPLEFAIHGNFLIKLVLYHAIDNECQLFCLSVHFGVSNPVLTSDQQYNFSKELLRGLISLIFHQNPEDTVHHQNETYRHLSSAKERSLSD